jgi:hypothetical protein
MGIDRIKVKDVSIGLITSLGSPFFVIPMMKNVVNSMIA